MTVAIVGPGTIGAAHAAAWREVGAEVSHLVSRRPDARLADAPHAVTVTDYATVLADPTVDIVTICTPTPTHREFAIAALRAGKHVLLEKPIALTIDNAQAIAREAEGSDGVLMVAHVVRFFDGYARVRQAVADGHVGHPLHVRAERAIAPPDTPWWYEEDRSGGVAVDLGIHDLDQANLLLGEPIAVRATATDALGPVETTVEYAGGGLAQVLSHARMPAHTPFATSIRVLGDAGLVEHRHTGGQHATDAYLLRGTDGVSVEDRDGHEADARDPYATQAAHFLECVASPSASTVAPTADAIVALRVALAARDSLHAGGDWLRLD
ncbi:Gfo/Idh/MocA family oxidoreductase [Humibacter soli]